MVEKDPKRHRQTQREFINADRAITDSVQDEISPADPKADSTLNRDSTLAQVCPSVKSEIKSQQAPREVQVHAARGVAGG